ncbi:MAG: hypothetical protein V3T39_06480, partial [Gammaproteobacteria bacterium]
VSVKHEIIFQTTRLHKAKRKAFTQTLTIDDKPCMRYYVSAYHVSRTSPRYEVRIYREETIKPCAKNIICKSKLTNGLNRSGLKASLKLMQFQPKAGLNLRD